MGNKLIQDDKDKTPHPEYLVRNVYVSEAMALIRGLSHMRDRMNSRKDCPCWLINDLNNYINRSYSIMGELKTHRDEMPRYREDLREKAIGDALGMESDRPGKEKS